MRITAQTFVVRCGAHGLFLGVENKPRAGAIEGARKFTTRTEAEQQAAALRARCSNFELPWHVEEFAPQPSGAA